MIRVKTIFVFSAFIATTFFACSSSVDEGATTSVDAASEVAGEAKQIPAFAMSDAAGNTVNLNSFRGKKVFVNLWATWCPPCRAEIPSIEALAARVNKDEAVFIMLSLDENFEVAKSFSASNNMQVPIYYPAENLPAMFNTDGIPATFIFDENGNLIKENMGADDYDTEAYLKLLTK